MTNINNFIREENSEIQKKLGRPKMDPALKKTRINLHLTPESIKILAYQSLLRNITKGAVLDMSLKMLAEYEK